MCGAALSLMSSTGWCGLAGNPNRWQPYRAPGRTDPADELLASADPRSQSEYDSHRQPTSTGRPPAPDGSISPSLVTRRCCTALTPEYTSSLADGVLPSPGGQQPTAWGGATPHRPRAVTLSRSSRDAAVRCAGYATPLAAITAVTLTPPGGSADEPGAGKGMHSSGSSRWKGASDRRNPRLAPGLRLSRRLPRKRGEAQPARPWQQGTAQGRASGANRMGCAEPRGISSQGLLRQDGEGAGSPQVRMGDHFAPHSHRGPRLDPVLTRAGACNSGRQGVVNLPRWQAVLRAGAAPVHDGD
jgi:hypothetical protein